MCARGVAAGATQGSALSGRVRSDGEPDLLVDATPDAISLTMVTAADAAVLECDQAARLLMLWGRDAQPGTRLRVSGGGTTAQRLRRLFSGY